MRTALRIENRVARRPDVDRARLHGGADRAEDAQRRGRTVAADLLFGYGLRNGFADADHLRPTTQVNVGAMQAMTLGSFGKLDLRLVVLNLFDRVFELRDGIGVGAPQYGPRRGSARGRRNTSDAPAHY